MFYQTLNKRNLFTFLHKWLYWLSGAADLSVIYVNRISLRSKPVSIRHGRDSIQLTVSLLNAAYYNNSSFLPRAVKSYNSYLIL
jgi:hypothetical protein